MIHLIVGNADPTVVEVVSKAFERSFTRGQIRVIDQLFDPPENDIVVMLAPSESDATWMEQFVRRPCKLLLLGPIPARPASVAGIVTSPVEIGLRAAAECRPAAAHESANSAGAIRYSTTHLGIQSPLRNRYLCRFDFTSEWNNLGHGSIRLGDGAWSIATIAEPKDANVIAELVLADGAVGAVVTLRDTPTSSILWFARPVGPVDGADWRVIESFVSDYRCKTLPCRPHLRDIPHGAGAAVTMRLDCDEAIDSARPLFELYRSRGLPLSLAVATGQPHSERGLDILVATHAAGGSILSHSVSHAPNWGGSPAAAEEEARQSKIWLEEHVRGLRVRYAVSPFHQNPNFVPGALARAGYQGFVGGSIASDPEYLMARGGVVPYGLKGFISHSQSCMLHGDCILFGADPMQVYREAFRIARLSGQFFGFLDHPFSSRYSYGWASEAQRLQVHLTFLDHMMAECAATHAPLLFVNEDTCLDFMFEKATTEIVYNANGTFELSRCLAAGLPLSLGFHGHNMIAGG